MRGVEYFKHDNKIYAIVLRSKFLKLTEGSHFITPPDSLLQVGLSIHDKDYVSELHFHPKPRFEKNPHIGEELIYVISGRILVEIYTSQGERIGSAELSEGDLIVIYEAHRVKFLERSKLLIVKQGPYFGNVSDKVYLHMASDFWSNYREKLLKV